jgi:dihydrodipicolinate synthase/N-acetylneuraminate lyase
MSGSTEVIANVVTPFSTTGELDEPEYARHVDRMASAGVGVFVGSPGSGEVHNLSMAEYQRTCELAVASGAGRVPVYAMTPEFHNVKHVVEYAKMAAAARVDEVQLFQFMGGHGMIPRRWEQLAYWSEILDACAFPVAISLHKVAGYLADADLVVEVCSRHENVRTVYTYLSELSYVAQLRGALPDRIRMGGLIGRGVPEMLMGVRVLTGAEPNVIPHTCRSLVDCFAAADIDGMRQAARRMQLVLDALEPWGQPYSRSLKMALASLGLLKSGRLRLPLSLPAPEAVAELGRTLQQMGVPDWEGLAQSSPPPLIETEEHR